MVGLSVEFKAGDAARWKSLCREWSVNMRKELPDVLVQAAWMTAKSARAHTPPCKAKLGLRDIVPNPLAESGGLLWGAAKYIITMYGQGRVGPRYIPTDDLADRRRVISHAGAAKNTWNGVMRGIGKPAQVAVGLGRGADWAGAERHLAAEVPYITLQNSLSYMPAIFPDAFPASFERAMRQMEARLTKQARKALARAIK